MKKGSENNSKNKNVFFREYPLLKIGVPVILIISMFILLSLTNAVGHTSADDIPTTENAPGIDYAKNFGGSDIDAFNSIIEVDGGYIAVGSSGPGSFGNGNWIHVAGKGSTDAIIVKFDTDGNVIWAKNFGGSGYDNFYYVTADSSGYIAVGYSSQDSFGNGSWAGVEGKGGIDATTVKFDTGGNVIWAKNFGGSSDDVFFGVTADSSGYIAAGYSSGDSFGSGDWTGVTGNGGSDSVVVKYSADGNLLWKKNFGVGDGESLHAVTSDGSGYIAAGASLLASSGDGTTGSVFDALIMKIDTNGELIWYKTLGEGSFDNYFSVISDGSGYVAVGDSYGTGSHSDPNNCNGSIVKFDTNGNVIWNKTFGGSALDVFYSVTAVSDGYVAAGASNSGSFGNGDWAGVTGKGYHDATIVKFDTNGNVVWKENFGGSGLDAFESVIAAGTSYVAAGTSDEDSFGNGDWTHAAGKGYADGAIVEFGNNPRSDDSSTSSSSQDTMPWVGIAMVIIVFCAAAAYLVYRRRIK